MLAPSSPTQIRIDPQGRVVIPAGFRQELGLQPGTRAVARIENGQLVLETPENVLKRLRSRFASIPAEVRLADSLIAERRLEAAREAENDQDR